MIQRVQTIYLFLAMVCAVLTFVLPFAHFVSGDVKLGEFAMFGVFNVQSEMLETTNPLGFPQWVFGVAVLMLSLLSIALYKKRMRQLIVTRFAMLITLAYICFLYFATEAASVKFFPEGNSALYHIGFYLPVISISFYFLAIRGIKKDEALVRSLDRIR